MLIGVRGIWEISVKLSVVLCFLLFFFGFTPPGNPNMFKMMPRDVGSISTPADFPSDSFSFFFRSCLTWGPQNLGLGVLNILGLGVLNRTWGPRHFRTWGPQQDLGSSTF